MTPEAPTILHPNDYDHVIVSFSGGKDSQACVLHLLAIGTDPSKIELWHQSVDGVVPGRLMDWPCTPDYCRKWAEAMGLAFREQWREGGFLREMLRENSPTAGVYMSNASGEASYLPTTRGSNGTRRQFPQVSADLNVRWCSAYLKIDVAARAINNDQRLRKKRILYVTGERREESAARAKYHEREWHRCSTGSRTVHHWRPVIDWLESDVWSIISNHGLVPHPAYRLGWSRLSCLACIFGNEDQWASVRYLARRQFNDIAELEKDFGKTIHRSLPVITRADHGAAYQALLDAPESLKKQALSLVYVDDIKTDPADWKVPAGAYMKSGGPT